MKIVFISDTHMKHRQLVNLPEADMIIHAGDITTRGEFFATKDFLEWFNLLDYKYKVFIAGNHDFCFEDDNAKIKIPTLLGQYPDITYLENESVEIEGIKIYGSPYTPRFYDWAFNVSRGNPIAREWAKIPDDTDILITHGPPFGYGDYTMNGDKAGCVDLLYRIKVIKPTIHVFGHIHEGYGMFTLADARGVTLINASVLDHRYNMVNEPVLIDYNDFTQKRDE